MDRPMSGACGRCGRCFGYPRAGVRMGLPGLWRTGHFTGPGRTIAHMPHIAQGGANSQGGTQHLGCKRKP
jgi:hypothetical protein